MENVKNVVKEIKENRENYIEDIKYKYEVKIGKRTYKVKIIETDKSRDNILQFIINQQ